MPAIGLGTFGSDHVSHSTVARAVDTALTLGYRHVDCASVYANESRIGEVLANHIDSTARREDFWISSKVWNDSHNDVAAACEASLRDLQLDTVDMYLVHWPFPNFHPPHCDVDERNPFAVPYQNEVFRETWAQMERLVERGLVRHIGTSNMTKAKLSALLSDVSIQPAVNQMELHPHLQQPELFGYLHSNAIEPIGFCPIGSPDRPERDRTSDDTSPTSDPVLVDIAERHSIHPATACVKWAIERGQTPIPFSTNPANIRSNLEAATTARFTDAEMESIAAIDRRCRLIKGQVFLWKDDQAWQDLWDEDGVIAT
jgi:alcohol dehydrogenase (NADP+)